MKHVKPNIAGFYILNRHKDVINEIASRAAAKARARLNVKHMIEKLIRASIYRSSHDSSGIIKIYVSQTGAGYHRKNDDDVELTTNKSLVSFYKER